MQRIEDGKRPEPPAVAFWLAADYVVTHILARTEAPR
jgi:hypothetical protein